MAFPLENINTPISTMELERRWAAVRAAMQANKIDALILQNTNDHMGGYVKYFTDLPAANGYPVTVVFPREDRMSVICQGPTGVIQPLPPEGDGLRRGVKQIMNASSFVTARYSLAYDAEHAEKALQPYAAGTIGMVGLGTLPVSVMDHIRGKLSKAKFVDASDMVDRIMVLKSAVEIALIRRTAALQDTAMKTVFAAIKPGMREQDASAVAEEAVHNGGGEQGIYLTASQPSDAKPGGVYFGNRHTQNRTLRAGDVFNLLIETNGPGGMYTELSRTCVLGKAPQDLLEGLELVKQARQVTLDLLKPGASCKDIWDASNRFLREHGKPEERRLYCHGQGYDLVERPLVRYDEPMLIQKDMNIACHPGWNDRFMHTMTDNYLIGAEGVIERTHKFPEIITEIR